MSDHFSPKNPAPRVQFLEEFPTFYLRTVDEAKRLAEAPKDCGICRDFPIVKKVHIFSRDRKSTLVLSEDLYNKITNKFKCKGILYYDKKD